MLIDLGLSPPVIEAPWKGGPGLFLIDFFLSLPACSSSRLLCLDALEPNDFLPFFFLLPSFGWTKAGVDTVSTILW